MEENQEIKSQSEYCSFSLCTQFTIRPLAGAVCNSSLFVSLLHLAYSVIMPFMISAVSVDSALEPRKPLR